MYNNSKLYLSIVSNCTLLLSITDLMATYMKLCYMTDAQSQHLDKLMIHVEAMGIQKHQSSFISPII